jgi:hypothetical protein
MYKFISLLKKESPNKQSYLKLENDEQVLTHLFNDKKTSDIKIISVDKDDVQIDGFYCHKIILMSYSEYLKTIIYDFADDVSDIELKFRPHIVKLVFNSLYINNLNFEDLESKDILDCIKLIMNLGITVWINKLHLIYSNIQLNDDILDEYLHVSKLFKDDKLEKIAKNNIAKYKLTSVANRSLNYAESKKTVGEDF